MGSNNRKTAVIIPTYNEKENIETLVRKIVKLDVRGLSVIIVDDNSPDGTGKIADKLSKKYKNKVFVIHRAGKLGLGSAYKAGYKKAFKDGYDCVMTMDADLSHDPKVIPAMLDEIKQNDLVIGSRYVDGGKIIGFGHSRTLLSSAAQFMSRVLLGLSAKDATSGYRAYKVSALRKIKPFTIKSEGYSYLIEALHRFEKKGFRVGEVPIVFEARLLGKSKISQGEIFKALKTVGRLLVSRT